MEDIDEPRAGAWRRAAATYRNWPRWARVAAPASAALIALAVAGALSGGPQEADVALDSSTTTATARATTTEAPATTERAPRPTTTVPPTTTPPTTTAAPALPPTTAAPPPPAPVAPAPAPKAPAPAPVPAVGPFANCDAARAAGAAPLHVGDPGYAPKLDRDKDGVACE
jgi:hypothetical protein